MAVVFFANLFYSGNKFIKEYAISKPTIHIRKLGKGVRGKRRYPAAATEAFRELIHMHTMRMKDRELVLTFFTLQNYNPKGDYRHFKDFLDNELAENVNLPE